MDLQEASVSLVLTQRCCVASFLFRLTEATIAAPADVLTFQRFGALRNPPVSERGQYTPARKSVGLIFERALMLRGKFRKSGGIEWILSPYFREEDRAAPRRNRGEAANLPFPMKRACGPRAPRSGAVLP
jgi:hypothetical protein